MKKTERTQGGAHRINVSGIDMEWQREEGTCTFEQLPVAMLWVDSTLAGLMSGLQAMVGPKRFNLALQSEGRKSVESDWTVISGHKEFQDGFRAIANIAAVAGWGEWELISLDEEKREAVFKVRNNWEGLYQRSLGVCWGSGMLAGKLAGYCSKLWNTNCWATQTSFIAKDAPHDEFVVKPSAKSIEKEIENLLTSDEATRADMAVALRKLEKMISDRRRTEQEMRAACEQLAAAEEAIRRQYEDLVQSEEQFRAIFEVSPYPVTINRLSDTTYVRVNRAFRSLSGLSDDDLIGKPLGKSARIPDEVYSQAMDLLMREGKIENMPSTVTLESGKSLDIIFSCSVFKVKGEDHVLTVTVDMTERKRVEEALRESERFLRETQKIAGLGGWMANPDTDYLKWTDGVYEIIEVDRSYTPCLSEGQRFFLPEYVSVINDRLSKCLATGAPFVLECEVNTATGKRLWTELRGLAPVIEGGRSFVIGTFQDITERKQAEKTIRESEERYRILTETSLTGIYVHQEGKVVYANDRLAAIVGYNSASELMGRSVLEFVHPEDRDMVSEYVLARFKGLPAPTHYETSLVGRDGSRVWVENFIATTEYRGRPAIMGNLIDITARKLAVEETERKARELAALNNLGREIGSDLAVESVVGTAIRHACQSVGPDVSMLFLREGEHLFLKGCMPADAFSTRENKPIHRVGYCLCGLSVKGKEAIYCRNIHTDPRCTLQECKEAGFQSFAALPLVSGAAVIGVLGVASRTERDFAEQGPFLEALSHEIAIGLKNAILYEKAQYDATELQTRLTRIREAEQEKESLMVQLQQAQKMEAIGTLAGGIAHDFNNILSPIIMGTELSMMSVPAEHEAHPFLERVLGAALRAKDLVNQILTFSRQSGQERIPLTAGPILKEAIKFARASLPATIEIRLDIGTKRDLILANPTQVHQVIMNLVTNAAHAMREKGGILEAVLREEYLDEYAAAGMPGLTAGNFLKLTVCDTGHGMERRIMEQIFDPFFTTKERGEGTGLGLSIVHGIISSYGGAIRVESQPGEGTTFTVYIPMVIMESPVRKEEAEPLPRGTERILLIDDETMITDTYSKMLGGLGYKVETQTNALDALDAFKNAPGGYDLVITDMTMPKMTGDTLTVELLRIRPDLPVILCTGFSEQITEVRAMEIGARAFVMKPIVIRELATVIRKVIDQK